ncbi:MAG: MOSC domain-containing protein [Woeseiaceae bacterium]
MNIGSVETVGEGNRRITTGICKHPVEGSVRVGELGLVGDEVVDEEHHGGPDQAVYAYSADDYRWWRDSGDRDFSAGLFGENLTIEGLPSNPHIGDRLLVGDVVFEVTSARIPCGTLATRMEDYKFGLTFREAERPGVYLRVLNPGEIEAGNSVTLVETAADSVTVLDLFRFAYETNHDADRLHQFLEAPIAERVRSKVESALAKLESS